MSTDKTNISLGLYKAAHDCAFPCYKTKEQAIFRDNGVEDILWIFKDDMLLVTFVEEDNFVGNPQLTAIHMRDGSSKLVWFNSSVLKLHEHFAKI